jgi:hypothetical protein
MIYTQNQIEVAVRAFRNAVRDLMNADYNTYHSRVKTVWHLMTTNLLIFEVLAPYLDKKIDFTVIEESLPNGWGKLNFPLDKDDRISYGLQVLKRFAGQENIAITYAFRYFYNETINVALRKTNEQLFTPTFRDVFDLFDDIKMTAKQMTEEKRSITERTLTTNIYVGNLTAQGPVAIGHDITQTVTHSGLSEEIEKALLQNNVSLVDIKKIREEIEEISNELVKETPNSSVLTKIFKRIADFGVQLAIPIIANTVNNPEVNAAVVAMFK